MGWKPGIRLQKPDWWLLCCPDSHPVGLGIHGLQENPFSLRSVSCRPNQFFPVLTPKEIRIKAEAQRQGFFIKGLTHIHGWFGPTHIERHQPGVGRRAAHEAQEGPNSKGHKPKMNVSRCNSHCYGVGPGAVIEHAKRAALERSLVCAKLSGILLAPPHGIWLPCRHCSIS